MSAVTKAPTGRRRADGPPVTDPTIVRDVAGTAVALVAVAYALVLGWFLPLGTSTLVFLATAGGAWYVWPALVTFASALLGGAR